MVYQSDKKLVSNIQNSGCYLLSLLWIAQVENRYVLTVEEINNYWADFVNKGFIDRNCTIKKPDQILNSVLLNKKIHQVGVYENIKYTYWGWVDELDKQFEYSIIQYTTTGRYGTHFTVGDSNFDEFYDPLLGEGYNSTGVDRFVLYKVFEG